MSKKTVEERLEEYIEHYRCKYHTRPSMDNPHGCTDCYNTGYLIDSEESDLIMSASHRINLLSYEAKMAKEREDKLIERLKLAEGVMHGLWSVANFSDKPDMITGALRVYRDEHPVAIIGELTDKTNKVEI